MMRLASAQGIGLAQRDLRLLGLGRREKVLRTAHRRSHARLRLPLAGLEQIAAKVVSRQSIVVPSLRQSAILSDGSHGADQR